VTSQRGQAETIRVAPASQAFTQGRWRSRRIAVSNKLYRYPYGTYPYGSYDPRPVLCRNMLTGRLFLSAFAALALSCAAQAGTINVFNTGVGLSGNVLPNGTIGDPHW
jgi:hypothetical protein